MKEQYIDVIKRDLVKRIKPEDVILAEQLGKKIVLITVDETVDFYEKIENVTPKFTESFYQCLQKCHMNFDHVISMKSGEILFDNGEKYCLGRTNFIKAKQNFIAYLNKTYKRV